MSNANRYRQESDEFEAWLGCDRTLPWRQVVLAVAILALIGGVNLYFWSPDVQRREPDIDCRDNKQQRR